MLAYCTRFSGNRLREMRNRKHMTTIQMARFLSCDPQTYQGWETGKRKPRADYINDLCRILQCGLMDLYEKDSPGSQPQ